MIFVDAHVHIYDCFHLPIFFESAFANFQSEEARMGQGDDFTAALLLTESLKNNWFERLASYASNKTTAEAKTISGWTFHRTDEDCSLCARGSKNQSLFLIAGRQIVTAEKLEVLALATDKKFKDGAPMEQVIQSIRDMGAIPVIPYGFGKWIGRRGKILRDLLKKTESTKLFLGDNGGRPKFLPRSSHFKQAGKKGIRVLPGSDPLPFPSQCIRPGSFGFSAEGAVSTTHPARDIIRILLDPTNTFQSYGQPEPFLRFFRNQLLMQIIKRRCSS